MPTRVAWQAMELRPRTLLFILLGVIAVLAAAHIFISVLRLAGYEDDYWGLVQLFDFDWEANIPAWFSSILLFLAGAFLLLIAFQRRHLGQDRFGYWFFLGVLFIFLSADEAASMHELLIPQMHELGASGLLYHAWVIPVGLVLAVIALLYVPWFRGLPARTRGLGLIAAAVYLGGAVVMEMIGGQIVSTEGFTFMYRLVTTLEESMEKVGLALWVYTLADFAAAQGYEFRVRVVSDSTAPWSGAATGSTEVTSREAGTTDDGTPLRRAG